MIATIDTIRKEATSRLDQSKRAEFGQFMTPAVIAKFMAGLFDVKSNERIHLLDAGAGIGSLSVAFLDNMLINNANIKNIRLTAYEIDPLLVKYLQENIAKCKHLLLESGIELKAELKNVDFIEDATNNTNNFVYGLFTHAILNPPYKKINSESIHRKLLSAIGFETVNLYSAFVALAIMLLKDKGELVAIIPRSFCNGNYYKSFRDLILKKTAIKQMHLFESRTHAFKDDDVLQENIIIHLEKGGKQGDVIISKSTNSLLDDFTSEQFPFDQVIKKSDKEYFIHIPFYDDESIQNLGSITYSLTDLGLEVSTGPVVDFRAKEYIFMEPNENTVPLLYPTHFNCKEIEWPKQGKKPNAITFNENTINMLFPSGYYTVIKRFSSKEEKQRIVARVIDPVYLNTDYIGFENHLNVIHFGKRGINKHLAYGIAAYLNSSFVDKCFRSFNGHTQVNATDLKQLKYPSILVLTELGKWAETIDSFDQDLIDTKLEKIK